MAINKYIVLDGKRYTTTAKSWQPEGRKPSTLRFILNGSLDATYGSGQYLTWVGDIEVPVTVPDANWGSRTDIENTLKKLAAVSFTDHYGVQYQVHIREWKKRSLAPDWESPSNVYFYNVKLEGKSA